MFFLTWLYALLLKYHLVHSPQIPLTIVDRSIASPSLTESARSCEPREEVDMNLFKISCTGNVLCQLG